MPRSTVLDIPPEEQAQILAALRRARYGYLLGLHIGLYVMPIQSGDITTFFGREPPGKGKEICYFVAWGDSVTGVVK